jgi:myo-inositol-1(or 4)-monophosphatase
MSHQDVLGRIDAALSAAGRVLGDFTSGSIASSQKAGGDPVTAADHAINAALLRLLPKAGEGWLSEETRDDKQRLGASRVWVVDPIDGTKEFIAGIPEWCVSIGYVEDGLPVAGGIFNPATGQRVLGAVGSGVTLNGAAASLLAGGPAGAEVLASRSEHERGEWARFEGTGLRVRALGSVAWKLACVAAGLSNATWTLVPKNEWDVAAGAALVVAAGGQVMLPDRREVLFNQANTLLPGFVAAPASWAGRLLELEVLR